MSEPRNSKAPRPSQPERFTRHNQNEDVTTTSYDSILPESDAAVLLIGVFVVLVAYRSAGEVRHRRRVFLTLDSAQRHADRMTMNGKLAEVVLCRLMPVHTFGGGEVQ